MGIREEVIKLRDAGLKYAQIGRELGISTSWAWRIMHPEERVKSRAARDPDVLTLRDAAKCLGVHPNTLRGWDKKGILKAYRIGSRRDRRFRREDIDDFLKIA